MKINANLILGWVMTVLLTTACATSSNNVAELLATLTPEEVEHQNKLLKEYQNPFWTPKEATLNFLKLLDSLNDRNDFSMSHIKNAIGLTLVPDNSRYGLHAGDGEWGWTISKNWGYGISLFRNQTGITLDFNPNPKLYPPPPMAEVCTVDVQQFHDALLGMGYEFRGNFHGPHGGAPHTKWYVRKGVQISLLYPNPAIRSNFFCAIGFPFDKSNFKPIFQKLLSDGWLKWRRKSIFTNF